MAAAAVAAPPVLPRSFQSSMVTVAAGFIFVFINKTI
jgi:hypothetical protein